jgi:DNA (cytosine-5)-methyltransferase 1
LNELALFAGAGGGILGGKLLGWRTVCAVEWEAYPASVLCARQNDGLLETFPIWDDVQTFDGHPWRGIVDVVSGGFPCQDISAAGKGAGIDGERSGMWGEMARIICEVRPRFVFVENSPMLTSRGLGRVLGDLAAMGFDAKWGVLGAADVGANHQRDRIWIVGEVANSKSWRSYKQTNEQIMESERRSEFQFSESRNSSKMANAIGIGLETKRPKQQTTGIGRKSKNLADTEIIYAQRQYYRPGQIQFGRKSWWEIEPNILRVADGMAARVDRLKAIGNGQVPLCAATAWRILSE